jgi:hypothetical protein
MSVKCDENTEVVTDLPQFSSMRRALIHTEKGLKDAVAMLRNDMIDIVTRIDKIEQKLNQVALKCCDCRCRTNEQVILERIIVNVYYLLNIIYYSIL